MNSILRTITILLALSLTACVTGQSNLTAGNDEDKDIGLGGTGMLASTDSGASSGLGGTGILGKITGYGSIFVNGIEIEYDSKTVFTVNGKTSAPQQLKIGDVVEVLTVDAKQHTQAQTINLRHEVIGIVESVQPQTYSFTVHGQSVVQPIDKPTFPEVGTTVAVSGFRINEQTILSTRITPAKAGQSLLQTHTELPFSNEARRWLIQTHIQNGKAIFKHNATAHVFSMTEKIDKDSLGLKILQLQKSATEQLELNQVIEPANIPSGRRTLNPVQQSTGSILKKPTSGSILAPQSGSGPGAGVGSAPTQPHTQQQMKQNRR